MADSDLELQYSPSRWSHRALSPDAVVAEHLRFLLQASETARRRLPTRKLAYGPGGEQTLEFLLPPDPPHGASSVSSATAVFVYLHGGYWQALDAASSAFPAAALSERGVTTVAVGYDLCPGLGLTALVAQVEAGVRRVLGLLPPAAQIFLGGHSAGAHLAAEMMRRLTADRRLRGVLLLSGVFDLRPLVATSVNQALGMDATESERLSPMLGEVAGGWAQTAVLLIHAQHDSPAFKRQGEEFARRLGRLRQLRVRVEEVPGEDHFTLVEKLAQADADTTQRVLRWMAESLSDDVAGEQAARLLTSPPDGGSVAVPRR